MRALPPRCTEQTPRTCHRCSQEAPCADFDFELGSKYYGFCLSCVDALLDAQDDPRTHTSTHRICYLCRRLLPIEVVGGKTGPGSAFTYRASKTNWFSACKECNSKSLALHNRVKRRHKGDIT